ncbi:tRNA (adenosine(37)-N6)-threonylcarbamoyltransferase complex transferase subunit TsaD [Halalkalibacillus halophilus]|uniref:tRNA (adenosine(37)-N6)-threonylcarbamoyltransferase complex transferase subunit TsaD n=1 Tax=Halalkalibacillus halophilus TaxID=392827 RepID=UPI0003F54E3E|nr:tRNA (adenosine(37)-N6)-threonylcarbamoyltransferase complex transferase subunit TsaD [Halalkalibacillus halophilus]
MKKTNEIILAIETSCDETAVAVIQGGNKILSNVVATQMEIHQKFGGVVPEVASRHHMEQITLVMEQALEEAKVTMEQIDAVAVTKGPGLVGALLVGVNAAKAIAFAHQKPLIAVHHIAGHIYANRFQAEFDFPLLSLVVSGGHSELIVMDEHGSYDIIGETRDDAAGEAYDKVAKALKLPYPGGPQIDRLAQQGEDTYNFPRAWLQDSYDFSFSGLKTAVINQLHKLRQKDQTIDQENIAASFQSSVMEVLVEKTYQAATAYEVKQLIVAGGVSANKELRERMEEKFKDSSIQVMIPPLYLCTDNAAMIGAAASIQYHQEDFADLSLNANPGFML